MRLMSRSRFRVVHLIVATCLTIDEFKRIQKVEKQAGNVWQFDCKRTLRDRRQMVTWCDRIDTWSDSWIIKCNNKCMVWGIFVFASVNALWRRFTWKRKQKINKKKTICEWFEHSKWPICHATRAQTHLCPLFWRHLLDEFVRKKVR